MDGQKLGLLRRFVTGGTVVLFAYGQAYRVGRQGGPREGSPSYCSSIIFTVLDYSQLSVGKLLFIATSRTIIQSENLRLSRLKI